MQNNVIYNITVFTSDTSLVFLFISPVSFHGNFFLKFYVWCFYLKNLSIDFLNSYRIAEHFYFSLNNRKN